MKIFFGALITTLCLTYSNISSAFEVSADEYLSYLNSPKLVTQCLGNVGYDDIEIRTHSQTYKEILENELKKNPAPEGYTSKIYKSIYYKTISYVEQCVTDEIFKAQDIYKDKIKEDDLTSRFASLDFNSEKKIILDKVNKTQYFLNR
ncbi:Uncharacterised protein [Acinetobacter nosocomialis]|uniref:hypothetical protein n=1 Tax=Acinetobacter nosocomialis TaxID=106654 RepID=UPI000DE70F5F|nr:hypothetical protein [Acinetobacter nosocomialis]SSV54534.1 Uncharacterised protein [Acinetobacter nosocomialis]